MSFFQEICSTEEPLTKILCRFMMNYREERDTTTYAEYQKRRNFFKCKGV